MERRRLEPRKLAAYVDLAHPILIRRAKEGNTITYGELINLMGGKPGMRYIGEVLGRITELEQTAGRPKLTAIVVRVDTGTVGARFFMLPDTPSKLLRRRGNHKLNADDQRYWHQQLTRVLQYWKSKER